MSTEKLTPVKLYQFYRLVRLSLIQLNLNFVKFIISAVKFPITELLNAAAAGIFDDPIDEQLINEFNDRVDVRRLDLI